MATTQAYTIGEVLGQLKPEFEDISISKIRFLESEGLIYPDRTPSGYRKFSIDDVDRLRFILTAQRDHYLPLRVIREQLARLDAGELANPVASESSAENGSTPQGDGSSLADARSQQISNALQAAVAGGDRPVLDAQPPQVSMDLQEFAQATQLEPTEVRALRDYGIIGESAGETGPFDGDDLLAARAARELLHLGLEARHLRMYRQFVDRELALFSQLVTPLLRQRNPEARKQAVTQLAEMAGLTERMKRSLLARSLREQVHGA